MSDFMEEAPGAGTGLDAERALKRLSHYCRAAGVGGFLMDGEGCVLGLVDPQGEIRKPAGDAEAACPLSRLLGDEQAAEELRSLLYGAYQAERFGGKYISLCGHSLLHWIAPIQSDGFLIGAFVGGPVQVMDGADLLGSLQAAGGLEEAMLEEARRILEAVPRIAPARATSLAELLADLASVSGGSNQAWLESARQREEQRSRISERIHELKSGREPETSAYPIEQERELLNAISRGDKSESQRLLNEILGYIFFATGQNPAVIRARALELVVLISRAALDGGADSERIFDLGFTYLNQIQKMRSVDDIAHWLSRVMVRFSDLVFNLSDVKHADVMMKALRFIHARFSEAVTLDEVAEAVGLSPTYFSKIWNEEMKCRFTAYLNKIRIDRGKVLLRTTDLSLVEIAGIVGYEDQSYFTKVFKKLVGLSPGRFRESAGRSRIRPAGAEEIHDEPS